MLTILRTEASGMRGLLPVQIALVLFLTPVTLWPIGAERPAAQAADVIDDPEAYAVYAAVLPARFSSGDKDFSRVAVLEGT